MIPNCSRHHLDPSEDECRECRLMYCDNCLVYAQGANARPLCIQCALRRSGIRGSRRAKPPRRVRRAHAHLAKLHEEAKTAEAETVVAAEAAANETDLGEAPQPGWVSLDASRWDMGAI